MKMTTLVLLTVLTTCGAAAQFTAGYQLGQAAFAEVGYDIGERWAPALRLYPFGSLENAGFGGVVTYDVYEREAAEVFVGVGLGYAAVFISDAALIIPVGLTVRPLSDRRVGLRAEVDLGLGGLDPTVTGTLGLSYRFGNASDGE